MDYGVYRLWALDIKACVLHAHTPGGLMCTGEGCHQHPACLVHHISPLSHQLRLQLSIVLLGCREKQVWWFLLHHLALSQAAEAGHGMEHGIEHGKAGMQATEQRSAPVLIPTSRKENTESQAKQGNQDGAPC